MGCDNMSIAQQLYDALASDPNERLCDVRFFRGGGASITQEDVLHEALKAAQQINDGRSTPNQHLDSHIPKVAMHEFLGCATPRNMIE